MTIKTAISIDEALFEKANDLASELGISRSRLFVLAVQEFIERYENRHMQIAVNAAYSDGPDEDETNLLQRQRAKQRNVVEDEW